ncbi:hypothetical protein BDV06DRAFT_196858 [Aspergillus oleicola]
MSDVLLQKNKHLSACGELPPITVLPRSCFHQDHFLCRHRSPPSRDTVQPQEIGRKHLALDHGIFIGFCSASRRSLMLRLFDSCSRLKLAIRLCFVLIVHPCRALHSKLSVYQSFFDVCHELMALPQPFAIQFLGSYQCPLLDFVSNLYDCDLQGQANVRLSAHVSLPSIPFSRLRGRVR